MEMANSFRPMPGDCPVKQSKNPRLLRLKKNGRKKKTKCLNPHPSNRCQPVQRYASIFALQILKQHGHSDRSDRQFHHVVRSTTRSKTQNPKIQCSGRPCSNRAAHNAGQCTRSNSNEKNRSRLPGSAMGEGGLFTGHSSKG